MDDHIKNLLKNISGESLLINYDDDADIAYFAIGTPIPAITSELVDDAWVRYSPDINEIVGFTVLDFKSQFLQNHPIIASNEFDDVVSHDIQDQQAILRKTLIQLAALVESTGWTPSQCNEVTPLDVFANQKQSKNFLQTLSDRIKNLRLSSWLVFTPLPRTLKPSYVRVAMVGIVLVITAVILFSTVSSPSILTGAAGNHPNGGKASLSGEIVIPALIVLGVVVFVVFLKLRRK